MPNGARGRLVVISGPSGVGKSTVVDALLARAPVPLVESVSATTRPPRPGEKDGVDYHFLTEAEFARRREGGDFLECVRLFENGPWYGTLLEEVTAGLNSGRWVLLEIEVEGARAIVQRFPDAVTIFIRPESWQQLEGRLRGRGTEDRAAIGRRLDRARRELARAPTYQHQVVNADNRVDEAVSEICDILTQRGAETR